MFEDRSDEPLFDRLVLNGERWAKKWKQQMPRILAYSAASVVLCFFVFHGTGSTDLSEEAIASMKAVAQIPAYRWLDNVADVEIGEHLLRARANMTFETQCLLGTVASVTDDTRPAEKIPCKHLFHFEPEIASVYTSLIQDTNVYLNQGELCACAPLLGKRIGHLAIRLTAETLRSTDAAPEELADLLAKRSMHIFNPVDDYEAEYENLDATRLAAHKMGLALSHESQDFRYNRPRGNYTLLRRTLVRITGVNLQCARERIAVHGPLALCVEGCLDLLRGVDVRERAIRQHRLGVKLNQALLDPPPPPPAVEPLKTEL